MNKWQEQVKREMTEIYGQEVREKPEHMTPPELALSSSLVEEEHNELQEAMGFEPIDDCGGPLHGYKNCLEIDLAHTAKEIGDLIVVALGVANRLGIDMDPVMEEVHRSNLSKLEGGHRRDDGKWVKGPKYTPADIQAVLDEQSQ
jgi:predicted HAD superfamily Cof-like phosphohydrolase